MDNEFIPKVTVEETIEKDENAWDNARVLSELQKHYGLYISAADYRNWRPTVRSHGELPGVASSVTIIATNGLLAYFVFDDTSIPPLYGHIRHFTGEVKTLFGKRKKHTERREATMKKAKKSAKDQMLELLARLTKK